MNTSAIPKNHTATLAPFHLSAEQFSVLSLLTSTIEPVTQGALANVLGMDESTLLLTLITLSDRCMLERSRDGVITITAFGARMLDIAAGFLKRHHPC